MIRGCLALKASPTGLGAGNVTDATAGFADAPGGDFSLTAGSGFIDKGVDTGLDTNDAGPGLFWGSAPDIGAEERP